MSRGELRVELDEKVDGALALARDRAQVFLEQRLAAEHDEVRREVALLRSLVGERECLRVGLEEEVERIEHRHLGDQIDLDAQLARLLREHEPGEVVRLRVLLPVDEVLGRRDLQRIGQDARAAMRRGPQAHDLRPERHAPVVAVVRDVIERDVNGHAVILHTPANSRTRTNIRQKSASRHHRDARGLRTARTFLNMGFWLWYFWVERATNNENRLDVIPFPWIPRRARGPRRRRTRRRAPLMRYLTEMDGDEIAVRQQAAELAIKAMGITFTVYHEQDGSIDRAWPLDIIPRTISRKEWQKIEAGLIQRAAALNLFIDDVYHEQKFIKDGLMPASIIATSKNFRANVKGIKPPLGTWAHICGSDLIRDKDGTVYVLEDNLRVPSGVSYMLENRQVVKRVFPELFESAAILPVDDYPSQLYDMLAALSPRKETRPEVVVLTPGIYNSAYFEHAYLARQMGCELVEGRDLAVDSDDCVYMQTVRGWTRVDVIYRRIDDDFLDQDVFRKDSSLGVPGLMRAWAAGKVALANAPGAGVADDKLVYTYVPDMIKYYLGEDAILPNVPSWRCGEAKQLDHVLGNLEQLVVKPVDGSGGYGMLMGPMSTKAERGKFADSLKADPRSFIAQPVVTLSTVPTLVNDRLEPRHVDLRPFILVGPQTDGDDGWLDARGAAQGLAGRELLAGRRQQGHVDRGYGRCRDKV